jgi:hypothetical protein
MLNRVEKGETEKIQGILRKDKAANVRISALLTAYGTETSFFDVWRQDYKAVVARLDSSFFICAENADLEEIAFFIAFSPNFRIVIGKSEEMAAIAKFLGDGYKKTEYDLLTFIEETKLARRHEVDSAPRLEAVFEVLESAKSAEFSAGGFAPWYADMSHRIRHGCARAFLLRDDGEPAAACLVSAESAVCGLIAGVAAKPQLRGRGYAAQVVAAACGVLCESKKLPVIECLPGLTEYYGKLGFKKTGGVTIIERT